MNRAAAIFNSVRIRLLVIALLPMLVLLPLLLGGTIWRWTAKVDGVLINKITGDLTIADQYLVRLIEGSGERLDALAGSAALREVMETDGLEAFLAQEKARLHLDFLYIEKDERRAQAWPVIQSAFSGDWKSAIDVFNADDLNAIDPALTRLAEIPIVPTKGAAPTSQILETRGMMIHSAAPLRLADGFHGALVGGVLLNRNLDFIDTINALVYRKQSLPEGSLGTATLFLDDVRISTNVRLFETVRALGTRVSAEVRRQVLQEGGVWLDRAFVVNDWYISAYEPIIDSFGQTVGMLYVGFLETPFSAAKRNTVIQIIFAFIIIVALSVPLFLRWASRIFRPLEGMMRTISQVEAGDLSARNMLPKDGGEISQLAQHLDVLLDRLQHREQELRNWAESLERRVEERTAALLEANQQLEHATERLIVSEKLAAVGEITASVAHEINNPVAVIQGNLELARDNLGHAAQKAEVEFQLIDDQVYRIGVIVSKLLQFARPEEYSGADNVIDPAQVVQDCLVLTRHQMQAAGIRCEVKTDSTSQVRMSRTEFQQVVVNLLVNAVHALEKGGTLRIAVFEDGASVCIEVNDTGAGIDSSILPKIFNPFFTTKQAQGTGLGLSISRQILNSAGGDISVRSEIGVGSCFRVRLPKKK